MPEPISRTVDGVTKYWDDSTHRWVPAAGAPGAPQAPMINLPRGGPSGRTDAQDLELLKQFLTTGGAIGGAMVAPELLPLTAELWGGGTLAGLTGAMVGGAGGRMAGHVPEAAITATTGQPNNSSFLGDAAIGAMEGGAIEASPKILSGGLNLARMTGRGIGMAGGDIPVDTTGMTPWQRVMANRNRGMAAAGRYILTKEAGLPEPIPGIVAGGPVVANKVADLAEKGAEAVGTGTLSEGILNRLSALRDRLIGPAERPIVRTTPSDKAVLAGQDRTQFYPSSDRFYRMSGAGREDLDLPLNQRPGQGDMWPGPDLNVNVSREGAPVGMGNLERVDTGIGGSAATRAARAPVGAPGGSVNALERTLTTDPYEIANQEMATVSRPGTKTMPDGRVVRYDQVDFPIQRGGGVAPPKGGPVAPPSVIDPEAQAVRDQTAPYGPADVRRAGETIADWQRRTLRNAAGEAARPPIAVQPSASLDALQDAADPAAALMRKWNLPTQGDIANAAAEDVAASRGVRTKPTDTDTMNEFRNRNRAAGTLDELIGQGKQYYGEAGQALRESLDWLKSKISGVF